MKSQTDYALKNEYEYVGFDTLDVAVYIGY